MELNAENRKASDWRALESDLGLEQDSYRRRSYGLAGFIRPEDQSVMDLGAGDMFFHSLLGTEVRYYPVDYTARYEETIVCDFNKGQFPDIQSDVIVCAGILEYIDQPETFLHFVTGHCRKLLLSYQGREKWIHSQLYTYEITDYLRKCGFCMTAHDDSCLDQCTLVGCFEKMTPETLGRNVECTGCGCCANVCPHNAIEMRLNENGYLAPVVDTEKCIHCGKCVRCCPVMEPLAEYHQRKKEIPPNYACLASDEVREKSSSGGVFTLLAQEILKEQGVVFGAAWNQDFTVSLKSAEDEEGIAPFRKSKYVQSNTEYTYREVKTYLEKGRTVLYGGLPCQIAGLKGYLGNTDTDKLLTVDLFCAQAPAPALLKRYLDENFGKDNVVSYTFRVKDIGWNTNYCCCCCLRDGTAVYRNIQNDYFQKAYHPRLLIGDHCLFCRWHTLSREGDLSLGDYWDIQYTDAKMNDHKGTSAVLVSTPKGRKYFDKITPKLLAYKELPIRSHKQMWIVDPKRRHPGQGYLKDLLQRKSFNEAVRYALDMHFDIGLVSMWSNYNYGASLSYFALYTVLRGLGQEVLMILQPQDSLFAPGKNVGAFRINPYPEYALEPACRSRDDLDAVAERCDTVMVGSDQLYSFEKIKGHNGIVTLDWVPSAKRKIVYGASFGSNDFVGDDKWISDLRYYLHRFQAVSVREKNAVAFLAAKAGIEADAVLEPVFLTDRERFDQLAKRSLKTHTIPREGGMFLRIFLIRTSEKGMH